MSGWAVITTHPQAERWACANLAKRGYACFLPTFIARRRDPVLGTLTRLVEAPLFAGYAFVYLDRRDPWTPVRYAPGVRTLLMDRDRVQFTRPGTVEALQQSEALRHAIPVPDTVLALGMPCSLRTGALRDQPAVLVAIGGGVATVAVLMFGELRELTVQVDHLVLRH
jgi:transcription antitermination factor NusG